MAKIPNKVIVGFCDVVDHMQFRVKYRTATGSELTYPADGSFLKIDALDEEAQARLRERLMQRISPAKRGG